MLQNCRAVEIDFEVQFLQCPPCHGVYENGEIYNCPRERCRWWPVVDEFLQQVADDDVYVPKTLFQSFIASLYKCLLQANP